MIRIVMACPLKHTELVRAAYILLVLHPRAAPKVAAPTGAPTPVGARKARATVLTDGGLDTPVDGCGGVPSGDVAKVFHHASSA